MGNKKGYHEGPWIFKGNALYQLNLVRSEEARKHVPAELPLVELFGWTLGGLYLARYSDSPAGVFDELVVLGGLVWNAPTSCAWASRVYVNSKSARNHGIKVVGLPSRLASFKQAPKPTRTSPKGAEAASSWWNADFAPHQNGCTSCHITIHNTENGKHGLKAPVAEMYLPPKANGWNGHKINMALPSFSGRTAACPQLMHYVCNLSTFVRPVKAIHFRDLANDSGHAESMNAILSGKPLLTLAFNDMTMTVPQPKEYAP